MKTMVMSQGAQDKSSFELQHPVLNLGSQFVVPHATPELLLLDNMHYRKIKVSLREPPCLNYTLH